MTDRTCIRGCTRRNRHYAACEDFGRTDGACGGCVLTEARDGALVCHRCYGQLRRTLERTPTLIEHMRTSLTGVRAKRYDHMPSGTRGHSTEPTSVDVLDASVDIMTAIYAAPVGASATPAQWAESARAGIAQVLDRYDELANDMHAFEQWWLLVMPHSVPGVPGFWTISGALARWPIEERRQRATAPCPDCDLQTVTISPPSGPRAPIWYACTSCRWERSERDDDGLWEAVFGKYDATAAGAPTDTELLAIDIPEWDDPLLTRDEAIQIAGTARTLQRWQKRGLVAPEKKIQGVEGDGRRQLVLFRRSDLQRAREDAEKRQVASRHRKTSDRSKGTR